MKRIPDLEKLEYGAYLYKKRYYIYCGGYDRIHGCTRWYGRLDKGDFKTLAEGDTLSEVVYHIDCLEKDKVHLDSCPFCGNANAVQLIPHGVGIRKFFIVRCVVKRGGCGASVTGKTRRLAEMAWNRNPPDMPKGAAQ